MESEAEACVMERAPHDKLGAGPLAADPQIFLIACR
jgi:hypothetical protein